MTDIALLWRPEQADALRARLGPENHTFPLSQKCYAAACAAGLPNVDDSYFRLLGRLDIPGLRQTADEAVHDHEAQHGASLDRPSIWHNSYEAAFVRAAAEALLVDKGATSIVCAAYADEPELAALAQLCAARGVPLAHATLARPSATLNTLVIPADLQFLDGDQQTTGRPWRFLLAVALVDLADQMRKAARKGPVVVALEADASGDAHAIYALARALGDTRILPLAPSGARFDERGDNTTYAAEVHRQIARAFAHAPIEAIVSDLRRVETELTARAAHAIGVHTIVHAHSGSVMAMPYRFDEADITRSVWTHSARKLDHAQIVDCPRSIRPPPSRRLVRLALRAQRVFAKPCVGVVVTTNELFAAPEAPLALMIDAFGKLCAATAGSTVILRLRRLEDAAEVWRAALPDADFVVETRNDRPFIPFARACDLIVELGSQSSAFLEASANAVPYVRLDAPPPWLKRVYRPDGLVPQITPGEAAALLRSPGRRAALGLRQFRALERDTRPT